MKAEPKIPVELACRNLWNFYALGHYDSALFDKFATVIVKHHESLQEVDVANALRAFAYYKHTSSEPAGACLESLVRRTIRSAHEWKLQTLAVVTNALADLDIQNTTVFAIVKNVIV